MRHLESPTLRSLTALLWFVFDLVQVGGAYSYDCSFGYIPNVELMKFISLATFGSYLPSCPEVDLNSQEMNAYHKAFLTYSFLKTPESMNSEYFCGETAMHSSSLETETVCRLLLDWESLSVSLPLPCHMIEASLMHLHRNLQPWIIPPPPKKNVARCGKIWYLYKQNTTKQAIEPKL